MTVGGDFKISDSEVRGCETAGHVAQIAAHRFEADWVLRRTTNEPDRAIERVAGRACHGRRERAGPDDLAARGRDETCLRGIGLQRPDLP